MKRAWQNLYYQMKKITLLLVLCASLLTTARAQENRLYAQYMFNMLAVNPAYAGNQYQFSATALNRAHWTGIKGAPVTQSLAVHHRAHGSKNGLGLLVNHDEIGIHDFTQVFGSYSYSIRQGRWQISFGLQGGVEFLQSNFNDLKLNDAVDAPLNGNHNVIKPNFGTGIFIDNGRGYIGLSVPTLLEYRDLNSTSSKAAERSRYFILSAGKVFSLSRTLEIKPSFIVRRQEGSPINAEISNTFIIDTRVFAALSYRTSKTAIAILQFQMSQRVRVGYAYEYAFNSLSPYGTGSHELMLNYRMDFSPKPCHTYY